MFSASGRAAEVLARRLRRPGWEVTHVLVQRCQCERRALLLHRLGNGSHLDGAVGDVVSARGASAEEQRYLPGWLELRSVLRVHLRRREVLLP